MKKPFKLFLILLIGVSLFGCGPKRYNVDYGEYFQSFVKAKKSYPAGEVVKLYFKDYSDGDGFTFIVDGEKINPSFNEEKGYIVMFTMPEHDISVRVNKFNDTDLELLTYESDKLEELLFWPGKTLQELEMFDYMTNASSIELTGSAFGKSATGKLFILDTHTYPVYEVALYFEKEEFPVEEAISLFEKEFSEIYNENEEPFVASNGGSLSWTEFVKDKYSIVIYSGSEDSFYRVVSRERDIVEGEMSFKAFSEATGYELNLKQFGFEKLGNPIEGVEDERAFYHFSFDYKDYGYIVNLYPGFETIDLIKDKEPVKEDNDSSEYELDFERVVSWRDGEDLWTVVSENAEFDNLEEIREFINFHK